MPHPSKKIKIKERNGMNKLKNTIFVNAERLKSIKINNEIKRGIMHRLASARLEEYLYRA